MSVRLMKLLALCLGTLVACSDGAEDQILTGRVATSQGALAIRAVADGEVITATPVRTDGSFTLTLPAGSTYRLEVLTRTGTKNLVQRSGNVLRDLSFKVCQPVDPFDVGQVGDPDTNGLCMDGDPTCTPCDPGTGMDCGQPPLPPTCDPMLDPNCKCEIVAPDGTCCQAGDPSCGPLPCMDPGDPTCCANGFCPPPCAPDDPNCCMPDASGYCEPPTPCDANDPGGNCEPPTPCDPMTDPSCGEPPGCQPGEPNCEPPTPCDPTTDPMCKPPCDAGDPSCGGWCDDPNAPGCAPPCTDPMDPSTCNDPCANDPASCGCTVDASGETTCWVDPQPCCGAPGTTCDPTDGMAPDHVPGDFGCEGM